MSTPETPIENLPLGGRRSRWRLARKLTFQRVPAPAAPIADADSLAAVTRRDRLYRRSLGCADALAAFVAIFLAVSVAGDDRMLGVSLLAVPLVVVVSKMVGLYDRDDVLLRKTTLDEAPALFELATLYTLVIWLLEGLLIQGDLGKTQVLGLWASLFGLTLLLRAGARSLARRASEPERCLIVGDDSVTAHLASRLEQARGIKAVMVGRVATDPHASHLEEMERLHRLISERDVHRVIFAPRGNDTESTLDVVRLVKGLGVRMSLLPRLFEVVGSSVEFDDLNGVTMLGVRRFGLTRSSATVKRAVDLVGAGVGIVVIAPLLLAIAIAIRLDSRGPLFFRQVRVGRDGRRFEMVKFRSMVQGADAQKSMLHSHNETEGLFKIARDPRVTRVGRLLRQSSLDELPQLINVLRGDMSLVGPRPLVVDEDSKVEGWHRRRLHLSPGMTGPWQILGSGRVPLNAMVKIDYLYVANWSLWTDVKILLRTLLHVAGRNGV